MTARIRVDCDRDLGGGFADYHATALQGWFVEADHKAYGLIEAAGVAVGRLQPNILMKPAPDSPACGTNAAVQVSLLRLATRVNSATRGLFALLLVGVAFYAVCLSVAEGEHPAPVGRIATSCDLDSTILAADLSEIDILIRRGSRRSRLATIGVSFGAVFAAPICLLAARNVGAPPVLSLPARWCSMPCAVSIPSFLL